MCRAALGKLLIGSKVIMKNASHLKQFRGFYKLVFYLFNFSRKVFRKESNADLLRQLRKNGQVIIPDFISPATLAHVQAWFQENLNNGNFEFPIIANAKIDPKLHQLLIDRNFLAEKSELVEAKVTADKNEFKNLEQFRRDFNPSTIKKHVDFSDSILRELWLSKTIIELVTDYIGFTPYAVEAYIRRNFPSKYKVMNHQWHRDTNHPFFVVKAFFFFSDCTIETGPHEYVVGSHQDMDLNGKPYYTEHEVEQFKENKSKVTTKSIVKAGTVIIEDTRGLHRAAIPEKESRDVGYLVFTFPPMRTRKEQFSHINIMQEDFEKLSGDQQKMILK